MGGVKHWLMAMQDTPEWVEGWEAYESGEPPDNPYVGQHALYKWQCWNQGWQDAKFKEYMDSINDDPEGE